MVGEDVDVCLDWGFDGYGVRGSFCAAKVEVLGGGMGWKGTGEGEGSFGYGVWCLGEGAEYGMYRC